MSIDWQAYEDGSLNGEDLNHAQVIHDTDRFARAEVEGLRRLKSALREAGMAEAIPSETLKRMLAQTANSSRSPRSSRRLVFVPILVGTMAAALLAVWVSGRLNSPAPQSATLAHFKGADPASAHTWLVSNAHRPAPVITASACHGKLVDTKYGSDWIAWDVEVDGQKYSIVGKKEELFDTSSWQSTTINGIDFVVKGDQIGWHCNRGMVYTITGGTAEGRELVACATRWETPSIDRT